MINGINLFFFFLSQFSLEKNRIMWHLLVSVNMLSNIENEICRPGHYSAWLTCSYTIPGLTQTTSSPTAEETHTRIGLCSCKGMCGSLPFWGINLNAVQKTYKPYSRVCYIAVYSHICTQHGLNVLRSISPCMITVVTNSNECNLCWNSLRICCTLCGSHD